MDTLVLDRRVFILRASAAAAIASLLAGSAAAQATPEAAPTWEDALKRIAGNVQPVSSSRMVFDVPEVAANGNMVPFTIGVDSPMTEKDYVKAIHILTTANPLPNVASFYLTPLSGRASVASRMRLARTQDVIAIAALSDGQLLMARRPVKVTIGGCGG